MDIQDIEQLVEVIRSARVSEIAVSIDGSRVRLRKQLLPATPRPVAAPAKVGGKLKQEPVMPSVEEVPPGGMYVTAPMVGIFHNVDGIGAAGSVVKVGQTVGAIESMKLMNDIVSAHDGVIAEVLIEDGMPVEYGQNLFRLEQA